MGFLRSMSAALAGAGAMAAVLGLGSAPASAQAVRQTVLFEDVQVFDGKSEALLSPRNVLVKDGKIATISTGALSEDGALVIDGKGKVLMPGLIDAHWHSMLIAVTPANGLVDMGYTNLLAGVEATRTLMRGFTTVRDLGGPVFGLKRVIDEGIIAGPRIYPSGAMLTVTGGHGDFRSFADLPRRPGELTPMETAQVAMVVDTPDEVRIRAREQLMQGASQIKMTAGGGVASPFSPLDVSTFTSAEIQAAVEAADNWGTYVGVHAYTPKAIQTAINAGVKVIEHGHLMDDETARLMAEKGIWLSTQPFLEESGAGLPPTSLDRFHQVLEGTNRVYELARKYNIKTAFGTDVLFSSELAKAQGAIFLRLLDWYTPAEALAMATGTNGELLQLSGPRNPYPGRIGLVEEGAYADLLLVDGDPIANPKLIADPENSFKIIMKDGVIYKNTLEAP